MWKGDYLRKERRNNNEAEKKQGKEKETWNENPNKWREKGITCRKKEKKKTEKRWIIALVKEIVKKDIKEGDESWWSFLWSS